MVAKNVLAYEIDTSLEEELFKRLDGLDNVDVLFQDFLDSSIETDIEKYDYKDLYFVSNVPYYITTPIVLKLIKSCVDFKKIVIMVQKEVGDRYTTKPGSKEYSSITVLLNYFYDIKKEFYVSRKNFIPEPNVDSVIVSFTPKENKLELDDFDFFEKMLRDSFQFKRKTIRNNLKKYDLERVEEVLKKYGFDLSVRAEQLSIEIFIEISNNL